MAVKTEIVNGKTVKLYPAFNTEAHAHDIEFRRNRIDNEIWDGKIPSDKIDEAERMVEDLIEILHRLDFPVTYLPYRLYALAQETILWAQNARHR